MSARATLEIEWPVTDAHTVRKTITRDDIERNPGAREALARYARLDIPADALDEDWEPDEDADIRDRWTVQEWLAEAMKQEIAGATHALARTLVLRGSTERGTDGFEQEPAQATQVQGQCGYRPEDHATEEWEEMKSRRGRGHASEREAAERGAARALETEMSDWLEGEGEGMFRLAALLE